MASIEHDDALEAYGSAREALNRIVNSDASPAEVTKAQQAIQKLDLDFIGANIASVQARTVQFKAFIDAMTEVIDSIGNNSPLKGLQQLKAIVDEGKTLLSSGATDSARGT